MNRKQGGKNVNILVGIDEVGRGPIAGPVTVGIFVIHANKLESLNHLGITDSKKLSPKKRQEVARALEVLKKEGRCNFVCISCNALVIDKQGIVMSLRSAIKQGLQKLAVPKTADIFLDGGLHAPDAYRSQKTIIKGDQKNILIGAASILAKVHRDAFMIRRAKKYPDYGFESHKGYGTKKHYTMIHKNGLCPLHRKSFLRNREGVDKSI
jgi:ribonuclease HII